MWLYLTEINKNQKLKKQKKKNLLSGYRRSVTTIMYKPLPSWSNSQVSSSFKMIKNNYLKTKVKGWISTVTVAKYSLRCHSSAWESHTAEVQCTVKNYIVLDCNILTDLKYDNHCD